MAGANLPAKKYSKTSPTITRLSFEFDGGTTKFIDIGLALSAINRKFYRQGVYYYVNSIEVYNNETGVVDLHTLPDNWITKNAWNRGFQMFQKMNRLVGPPIGAFKPKYHDFKVYMNDLHRTTGSNQPVLHTINGNPGQEQLTDDWVYSEFVSADADSDPNIQDPDKFNVHMIGAHSGSANAWDSVSLIKSYAETRGTVNSESPDDANIDITDPLLNLFDFSSEEQLNSIAENLLDDNDNPPYNYNQYVGEAASSLQHVARIGTEVGVGRVGRAAGFCAPFGLICVDPHGVSTAFRVVLNLAVGTYHGVYAERA
jgi:hypothetical protein